MAAAAPLVAQNTAPISSKAARGGCHVLGGGGLGCCLRGARELGVAQNTTPTRIKAGCKAGSKEALPARAGLAGSSRASETPIWYSICLLH